MEPLRWILLVVGVVFVLFIYILGRNRRRRNDSIIHDLDDDLPEFSAQNLDDLDEGVGEVRVVTGEKFDVDDEFSSSQVAADKRQDEFSDQKTVAESEEVGSNEATGNAAVDSEVASKAPSDIIVLYILPKSGQELIGAQINSSVQAMGLRFGEMNIFHYRPGHRNIFSLANMLEPGSFDADTIHDLKTSGLTIFMQITEGDPLDDLTEMLQRSYQLAGLLGARLCNSKRQSLTEQDAENYRTQVREFIAR
ncbi:MAG: cell division protein ZipA C-terminal FtsZ-binding domain-containing protein [Gammaproteobacteria bacterium]